MQGQLDFKSALLDVSHFMRTISTASQNMLCCLLQWQGLPGIALPGQFLGLVT